MRTDINQPKPLRILSYTALCALNVLGFAAYAAAEADYGDNFSGDPQNISPLVELYAVPVSGHDLLLGNNNDLETATNTPPEGSGQGDVDDGILLMHETGWYPADSIPLNPGQSYLGSLSWKYNGNESYDYSYYVFADTNADGRLDSEVLQGSCNGKKAIPACPALGQSGINQDWNLSVDASAVIGSHGYVRTVITEIPILPTQNDYFYPNPQPSIPGYNIRAVAATSDGGAILAGSSYGWQKMRILKVDAQGQAEWDQVIGTNYAQAFQDVIESVDEKGNPDGYLAVGYSNCLSCSKRVHIIKFNLDGSMAWERIASYLPEGGEWVQGVIQTSDASGDFVIASMIDFHTLRLVRLDRDDPSNPASDVFDVQIPLGSEGLHGYGLALIESKQNDGSPDAYVIAAPIYPGTPPAGGSALFKFDHTSGALVGSYSTGWIAGTGAEERGLVQTGDGGSYFVSMRAPNGNGLIVHEVDFSGQSLLNEWVYPQFSTPSTIMPVALARDGARYFLASSVLLSGGAQDGVLQEIDVQGNTVGDPVYYGGQEPNWVRDMVIDEKGCIDIVGSTTFSDTDAWLHAKCPSYAVAGALSGGEVEDYEFVVGTTVNQPPVAVDDSASTSINKAVNVKVLLNDYDPNGDTFSITSFTQPAHGTVVLTGQGKVLRYTPAINYQGSDSFTYTIQDSQGAKDTAKVTVAVLSSGGGRP